MWRAAANHIPSCRRALQRGANYGHAQLRPSELQKSKLIDQALTLLLRPFPLLIGGSLLVNQARELCFSCIPGLARSRELALKKGDPLSCLITLPMGKSQQDDPFLGYPLRMGGSGPYHDGGRPCLSNLLPNLYHFSRVPG
jgi:hypothetical protein